MSLDVCLLRERLPDDGTPCRHCDGTGTVWAPRDIFQANITHNLGGMANLAGIYDAMWRPEELGITKAAQLIQPLRDGLALLHAEPDKLKALNPSNGWGSYEGLLRFVTNYLAACEANPDAEVSVSR